MNRLYKKINAWFKRLDEKVLYRLSVIDNWMAEVIYEKMENEWKIINKAKSASMKWNITHYITHFIPTWYNNSKYYWGKEWDSTIYINTLKKYLKSQGIIRMLVWHWWNQADSYYNHEKPSVKELYDVVIRCDRSYDFWNIWYVRIDTFNEWKVSEVSDYNKLIS